MCKSLLTLTCSVFSVKGLIQDWNEFKLDCGKEVDSGLVQFLKVVLKPYVESREFCQLCVCYFSVR